MAAGGCAATARYNVGMTTLRARYDGRVLIPVEPVDFEPGQEVDIQVVPVGDSSPVGSPAALLAAVLAPPHLSAEDMDEFERILKESERPPETGGIFDDLDLAD